MAKTVKAEVRRNENPAAKVERERIVALINAEAKKLEDEGSPTAASIVRGIVQRIERSK